MIGLFLLPALMACLILTGIHTYLGLHVLRRGVIFLDIALAQIAALGITIGLALGFEPGSAACYFSGLAMTSVAALLFTFLRHYKTHQETIIGISFVVSSALALLIANGLPHGAEHVQEILTGNILWATWPDIQITALIYSGIGLFHYIFRNHFLSITFEEKDSRGWDLLFYLSFGLVITSSVQLGGILLVFTLLIIPAFISQMLATKLSSQIYLGWLIGTLGSTAGIALSYFKDWPTSPTIIVIFGALLALVLMRPVLFRA